MFSLLSLTTSTIIILLNLFCVDSRVQQFRVARHQYFGDKTTSVDHKTNEKNEKRNLDEPFKYFGSPAEKIRATPTPPPRPTFSPYIVHMSLAAFLIYFCILREENDVDELLNRDLFDHFGEESSRLKKAYDYNIKNNLPTSEIVNRLREIGAPVPPSMR